MSVIVLIGLPGYALAAPSILTSPAAHMEDGVGGFEELDGPKGITTVTIGSSTYALVAAYDDDGIQIINITTPSDPIPVASLSDGQDGYEELEGARYVTTVAIGSSTYALVSASADHGIQIINITTPSDPSPTAHISSTADLYLADPRGIATFTIESSTYAAIAGHKNYFHILDITDPSDPTPVSSVRDGFEYEALSQARGVDIAQMGSSTYAIVASYGDNGVQIINVTDPSDPAPVAAVGNSQDNRLGGATGITVVTIGSSTYALVASQIDDAVQIINITDPSNPESVAFAQDGNGGFDRLSYPEIISTVTFGSSTYAVVAAFLDGIQIMNITDPSDPRPAASIDDYDARFGNPALPESVAVVTIGSKTYALVVSNLNDSVSIIGIGLTHGPQVTSATLDEGEGTLEIAFSDRIDVTPARLVDVSRMSVGGLGQSVSLAGATLDTEADSEVISVNLTASQSRLIAAMESPRLDVDSSAVRDANGNLIDSTLRNAITVVDEAAPEVTFVTWDEEAGMLEIGFSDRIDVTPAAYVYLGGMTIRGSGQSVSLAGATLDTEADSTVIAIRLTAAQGMSVAAMSAPLLEIGRDGVADTDGNYIGSSVGHAISIGGTGNTPVAGAPAIAGTVQVGQTLTVVTTSMTDADGMSGAAFGYQWISNDGSDDSDMSGATGSSHVLAAADQGKTIKVRVSFTDDAGNPESATSAATQIVAPATAAPGAPRNVTALPGGSGALNVAWQAPASNGGAAITGYTVQWKESSGSWTAPADVSEEAATGTSHSVTGLADGTTYSVRVVATNTAGDGEPSADASATTTIAITVTATVTTTTTTTVTITPIDPRDIGTIRLNNTLPGVIQASWDTPTETPVDYRISWAKVGEGFLTWTDLTGNAFPTAPSHTITGLEGGEEYKVIVRARYAGASGDWSGQPIINVTRHANSPPTADAGEPVTAVEGTAVSLNGTASDQDNDPMTYSWSHDFSGTVTLSGADSLFPSFTAPSVSQDTTITFTLTADDGNANATDTVEVTVTNFLPTTAVQSPPQDRGTQDIGQVTLTASAPGTIEASWGAPSETPVDYRISWAKVGEEFRTWTDLTGNAFPTAPSHTITGLEEGEEYKVIVRARYAGASGDWSNELAINVT